MNDGMNIPTAPTRLDGIDDVPLSAAPSAAGAMLVIGGKTYGPVGLAGIAKIAVEHLAKDGTALLKVIEYALPLLAPHYKALTHVVKCAIKEMEEDEQADLRRKVLFDLWQAIEERRAPRETVG